MLQLKCPSCGKYWTRENGADVSPKEPCPWCEKEVVVEEAENLAKEDIW